MKNKLKQFEECYYKTGKWSSPIIKKGIFVATIPEKYRKNELYHIVITKNRNICRVSDVMKVDYVKKEAPKLDMHGKQYILFEVPDETN